VDLIVYALGGGWGHLTRAVALARFAPAGGKVRIIANSPYAPHVRRVLPDLDIVALDPEHPIAAARECVAQQIRSARADCLVVDTFARGLGGELVDIVPCFAGKRVLIQRDLNPHYTSATNVREFVDAHYDLVLIPGDASAMPAGMNAHVTAPWIIRSADELLTREAARALLKVDCAERCVLICAAGNPEESGWYGGVAAHVRALDQGIAVRTIAPVCPPGCPAERWVAHWPAIDLYAAADVIVGGAGYNTIHECLACAIPLIARPWARKYDRQHLRAERASRHGSVIVVRSAEEAASAAITAVRALPRREAAIHFENGAAEAYALIDEGRG
jgi:hypothetical protein